MNVPTFWRLNWEKLKSNNAADICNQQSNIGEADGLKKVKRTLEQVPMSVLLTREHDR